MVVFVVKKFWTFENDVARCHGFPLNSTGGDYLDRFRVTERLAESLT